MPLNIRQEGPVRIAPVTVQKAGDPSSAVRATAVEMPVVKKPVRREDPTLASLANPRRIVTELPMPVAPRIQAPPPKFGDGIPGPRKLDELSDDGGSGSYTDEGSSDDESGSETVSEEAEAAQDKPFESMEARAERIRAEKTEYLNKLYDYARKGEVVPEHLGLRSTLDELREAVDRIKHSVAKRASVKFQGRMLVTVVTGLELLNSNMDIVGPDLDGWSHTVMTEVTDYETAFEELYDLYGQQFKCHPLITIMFMLGFSGWNHMAFAKKRRDDGETSRAQAAQPARPPPPRPQPPQASAAVPATRISAAASTQDGPGETRPRPRPADQPPFNAAAGAASAPASPYVMKGPSGLGVLPGFSPLGLAPSTGPATASAQFPASPDLVLQMQAPEMAVPLRGDVPASTTIIELPSEKPKRGRPRKNAEDSVSEAGVQI